MPDIFNEVAKAAGIVRGKKHGTAGEKWRGKAPSKSNPTRKASSTSKSTTRKTASQQVKENISAAEAAAKAQGFTKTKDGTYVKTSIYAKQQADAARMRSKAAERSDVNKMAAARGTAVPKAKAKKVNKRNAKRRVKGSK